MVRAVRAVSAERGHDPAGMTLVAFGGNGPLHGVAVAAALGIPRVLVPPAPGVFSAWGLLAVSIAHHASRTHLRLLRGIEEGPRREVARSLRAEALAGLATPERAHLAWSADLRYAGQSSELNVPLSVPVGALPEAEGVAAREGAFGAAHERATGTRPRASRWSWCTCAWWPASPPPSPPSPPGLAAQARAGPPLTPHRPAAGDRVAPTSALSEDGWTCPWWIGRLWPSSLSRAADRARPGP